MKGLLDDALCIHELTKSQSVEYQSNKYVNPGFAVGYKVWASWSLLMDFISRLKKGAKLAENRFGPFQTL